MISYADIVAADVQEIMHKGQNRQRKAEYERRHGVGVWRVYNAEKAKIDASNLSPSEYDAEIRKLTARLGI